MKKFILHGCATDLPEPLHGEVFAVDQDPNAYADEDFPEATGSIEHIPDELPAPVSLSQQRLPD